MGFRPGAVLFALFVVTAAAPVAGEDTHFGERDPGNGTLTGLSIFTPELTSCPGQHLYKVRVTSLSFDSNFASIPWLVAPKLVEYKAGDSYPGFDIELQVGSLSPGTHGSQVVLECVACDQQACKGNRSFSYVTIDIPYPATFGASPADAEFGGLVDGRPMSAHDLIVSIVSDVKESSFMELDGASDVITTLENKYLDRALTSNDLSDVSFVRTNGKTAPNGSMGVEIVPVDDEEVLPGNARYISWGLGGAEEEIFIGVDMSLKGITAARKDPGSYFIFTLDGDLGVIKKADLVHNIIHEGFHAAVGGAYNVEKPSGARGASLEEERAGLARRQGGAGSGLQRE